MMPPVDLLHDFDRAAALAAKLADGIEPGQFELPAACPDWSARAVVNHLTHGNHRIAALASGGPPPPDGDFPGADPPAAFADSVAVARAALSEPGLFERTVSTPMGPAPGSMLVHLRVNEFLVHAWDIADALGAPTDFLPDLAESALQRWRARLGDQPRPAGGPFAEEKPAPEGATAAEQLAAFLGRESVRK